MCQLCTATPRIHQRRDQFNKLGLYLQVMWKHVGQKSFPMTEAQYMEQLVGLALPGVQTDYMDYTGSHRLVF
jgi:hypothetical protein